MDAPVYKKLIDIENQNENPYHTAEGLVVTSEAENFWVRLSREGTHVSSYKNLACTNSLAISELARAGAGKRFYPKRIILTSTVRITVIIAFYIKYGRTIEPTVNSMPTVIFQQVVLPPDTCQIIEYDGDLFVDGSDSPIQIRANSSVIGESGTLFFSVDGWEVALNA